MMDSAHRGARGFGAGRLVLMMILSWAATDCFAQSANERAKVSPSPAGAGEIWVITTVTESASARDAAPKRERQQELGCFAPGAVSISTAADVKLPDEFKAKCWMADRRAEPLRQQVKYACGDGITAEAATRQQPDGTFGSQIVLNVPEKGGISITRTMRKSPGKCDLSKVGAIPPAQPKPPEVPAASAVAPPK